MAAPHPETVGTVVKFDRERGFTTGFRIITADERLRERRGVKAVLLGISGIGKTTLLWTLPSKTPQRARRQNAGRPDLRTAGENPVSRDR